MIQDGKNPSYFLVEQTAAASPLDLHHVDCGRHVLHHRDFAHRLRPSRPRRRPALLVGHQARLWRDAVPRPLSPRRLRPRLPLHAPASRQLLRPRCHHGHLHCGPPGVAPLGLLCQWACFTPAVHLLYTCTGNYIASVFSTAHLHGIYAFSISPWLPIS